MLKSPKHISDRGFEESFQESPAFASKVSVDSLSEPQELSKSLC